MTDKERTVELTQKAKESYRIYSEDKCIDSYEGYQYIDGYCNGYEQGYEDCRHYAHDYYKPKWHDLRKNPNDLPDRMGINSKEVYVAYSDNNCTDFASYNFDKGVWERSEDDSIATIVIAWCELPKFKE